MYSINWIMWWPREEVKEAFKMANELLTVTTVDLALFSLGADYRHTCLKEEVRFWVVLPAMCMHTTDVMGDHHDPEDMFRMGQEEFDKSLHDGTIYGPPKEAIGICDACGSPYCGDFMGISGMLYDDGVPRLAKEFARICPKCAHKGVTLNLGLDKSDDRDGIELKGRFGTVRKAKLEDVN